MKEEEFVQRVIENFVPRGGKHCITNSLKQIFEFYGYPISEEMLFGIGEGLDFTYINLAGAPMVSGRVKVGEFEAALSKRLGISIRVRQSKDYISAFHRAKEMLDSNKPVLVYVDMPYLDYLGMDEASHFGGHSIVLFGYDDEKECFFVSERDNSDYPIRTPGGPISEDYHLVSYAQMQKARSSNHRPFPANNKYLEFDFSGFRGIPKDTIVSSIIATCERMLNPPANLKGINGIAKFSKEVIKWGKFDREKLKRTGATNYFQINADGGTGGGIFRRLFGGFLIESAPLVQNAAALKVGQGFIVLASIWDTLAQEMWHLHETGEASLLDNMSAIIAQNYDMEERLLIRLQREFQATN